MKTGLFKWNYISSMQSEYHSWFQLNGFPELDILKYEDGSWYVIQYYNAPLIPSMTRWQTVLGEMRNVEISSAFLLKYLKQLDITKKAFWDREEAKTKETEEEFERVEKHREESAEFATQAIVRNPNLMNRIAKNGLCEMDLGYIANHVPTQEIGKPRKITGVISNGLSSASIPANETIHEGISKGV